MLPASLLQREKARTGEIESLSQNRFAKVFSVKFGRSQGIAASDIVITASQIRDGSGYFGRHLSANDYYSEGESVQGEWIGKGARILELQGKVTEAQYEALRTNKHPASGEKLTPRRHKVAFHDIVLSAPKSFSVAAIVGGDERLVEAFRESTRLVHTELEKFAAVRLRAGELVKTEATLTTGNVVTALFHHDSSRLLQPQLHAHLVTANVSWCDRSQRWLALQPRAMLEASKASIRTMFYNDLAERARALGYEVSRKGGGFKISGISQETEDRYSQRALERRAFEHRYRELFGRDPGKDRIEAFIKDGKGAASTRFKAEFESEFQRMPSQQEIGEFVKDWRSSKLKKISTAEVRERQLAQLTLEEREDIAQLVANARQGRATKDESSSEEVQGQQKSRMGEGEEDISIRRRQRSNDAESGKQSVEDPQDRAATNVRNRKAERAKNFRRQKLLKQIRNGRAVANALSGHPAGIISRSMRASSRKR